MEGYAAYLVNPGDSTPIAYWDGYTFNESIDTTKIFPTRADVKTSTSGVVTQYTDHDIVYVPAKQTIVLGTPGSVINSTPPTSTPPSEPTQTSSPTTLQSS